MKVKVWLFGLFLCLAYIRVVDAKSFAPAIKDFGTAYPIKERTFHLPAATSLRAVFDIYDNRAKVAGRNKLIDSIARLLNMHALNGHEIERFQIIAVVHGRGIYDVLSDKAYQKRFGKPNPNRKLIQALQAAGVRFMVCGQTLRFANIEASELLDKVDVALSAMTVLIYYQNQGFAYIRQ